mgnify:CR=1 FL=1
MNYKSWRVQKKIPIKIIQYEDLLKETYVVFKDIIEFINKTLNIKEEVIENKTIFKISFENRFYTNKKALFAIANRAFLYLEKLYDSINIRSDGKDNVLEKLISPHHK